MTRGSSTQTYGIPQGVGGSLPRSAHCSLMRTHKPGSPLLLCPARTPVPLAQVLTHCRLLSTPSISPSLRTPTLVIIPRSQIPRPRNVISDRSHQEWTRTPFSMEVTSYMWMLEKTNIGRSERAPIASGGGMRRSEEARVSEEAVRRKGGEGGPRKLGMGYGEAEEPV